jgi:dCTP deaminase
MMLTDRTIAKLLESGDLDISPPPADVQRQPVSVDLLLGNSFTLIDEGAEPRMLRMNKFTLQPGGFVLACTLERVALPAYLVGLVHGKSSLARQGLQVEAAGLVDPGFDGVITLELFNQTALPLALLAGQSICQISFQLLDEAVQRPYGSVGLNSHYQGQRKAEPAR